MSQAGLSNLINAEPSIPTSFTTDSGTAVPAANVIDINGGTGITTSGLGNVITITSTATIPTGASGTVLQGQGVGNPPLYSTATYPSTATGTGTLLRADGTNWTVTTSTYPATNAVSTLLYASAANVMSALATANNGMLVTSSTGVPSVLAGPGTTGNILQSNAAAAPSFSTATYPSTAGTSGKVLISDGTNIVSSTPTYPNAASTALKHIKSDGTNFVTTTVTYPDASVTAGKVIISDGTNYIASTPTYPNTSGTAGKVVISDGTNNVYSTPTFPNASATSGKIIKSDGTNWLASTETYAAPSTSGNLMTSDGTNWTSANPTVYSATLNLTNAQIKSLFTVPITIVAAQGAGTVITVFSIMTKFTYGGTNAFTGGGNLNIRYVGTAGQSINAAIMTSALILGTASVYSQTNLTATSGVAIANVENQLVCIHNLTAAFTGNAANNNLISVKILYGITQI
jgi:hypothetical protein